MCYPKRRPVWVYNAGKNTEVSESRSWQDASEDMKIAGRKCITQECRPSERGCMCLHLTMSVLEKVIHVSKTRVTDFMQDFGYQNKNSKWKSQDFYCATSEDKWYRDCNLLSVIYFMPVFNCAADFLSGDPRMTLHGVHVKKWSYTPSARCGKWRESHAVGGRIKVLRILH